MKAVKIKWDTDGDKELLKTLPKKIKIPKKLTSGEIDYDAIDDYLSDKTGFCHFGYKLVEE